jgi:hypothetical protein
VKFYCPNCKREEEILLDRKQRFCPVCRVEMIVASDYSGLWMSPHVVIARRNAISQRYGFERAKGRRFKQEREAWTTGVLGLAFSKHWGIEFWVEVETVEPTPDTKLHYVDQSSGHNVVRTFCIEVVDWQENVEDIMEVIKKKCSRPYPNDYLLVVHARHIGKALDYPRIVEEMKKMRSRFAETWVIAGVGEDHVRVVRVAPSDLHIDLKPLTELVSANKTQPPIIKGKIRGLALGLTPSIPPDVYLPIPTDD